MLVCYATVTVTVCLTARAFRKEENYHISECGYVAGCGQWEQCVHRLV